jgi:hypothetical protein
MINLQMRKKATTLRHKLDRKNNGLTEEEKKVKITTLVGLKYSEIKMEMLLEAQIAQ